MEQKMLTSCLWLMPVLCCGASYILLGKAIGKNINVILAVVILLVVILSIIALSYIPVAKSKKQLTMWVIKHFLIFKVREVITFRVLIE